VYLLSFSVEGGERLISHDEITSDKPHDVGTTSGINCGRKDTNQTSQNLCHPVSDQKLSNNSVSVTFGRGNDGARSKARRSAKNVSCLVPGGAYDESRSKSSEHVPADCRSAASAVKENRTARLDDCHRTAYRDGVGAQHHSKQSRRMKPECRGSGREYRHPTRTVVASQCSSIKNSSQHVHIPEDWEAELCLSPSSESNVIITTDIDMPRAVVTTSGVEFSVAAKGNEKQIILQCALDCITNH